jgi:hypothetical protein
MEALTNLQSFILHAIGIILCLVALVSLNKLGIEHGTLNDQIKRLSEFAVHTDRVGFNRATEQLKQQKKTLKFWVLVFLAGVALCIITFIVS